MFHIKSFPEKETIVHFELQEVKATLSQLTQFFLFGVDSLSFFSSAFEPMAQKSSNTLRHS